MEEISAAHLATLIGAIGGVVLGLAARLGGFCTMGAVESAAYGGDQRQLRMWGVALGVAIPTATVLTATGAIDPSSLAVHRIEWNPLASAVGGLIFGYGMALAGNCGYGALARVAGGDLRALAVTVTMGIAAYATLVGPLAPLRVALFPVAPAAAPQSMVSDLGGGAVATFAGVALGLACLGWALAHAPLRAAPRRIGWAAAVGAAIAGSLAGMSWLSRSSFGAVAVEGHSFTAPLGETLLFMMTAPTGGPGFAIGSVLGVVAGAAIGSALKRQFRWEACDDPRELGRQFAGAALMGFGGVVAMGCSVGQGLTAFATLAWSAPVTLAAIAVGALFGLRQLIRGFQPE